MHFTIYKITNKINNMIYIGKHQTKNLNDGYFGSGKRLKYAINKYGLENFTKEILFVFDNEQDMNAKEAELVTEEFCKRENTYNICVGGKGGWSYINTFKLNNTDKKKRAAKKNFKLGHKKVLNLLLDDSWKKSFCEKISSGMKDYYSRGGQNGFLNKSHSEKTKSKIGQKNSLKQKGKKNSQFGTCWITNGKENKKIKKEVFRDWEKLGFYRGRV